MPHQPAQSDIQDVHWVLGLAIQAYKHTHSKDVMYVVMLEDGREIHVSCANVQPIILLSHVDQLDNSTTSTPKSMECHHTEHETLQEQHGISHIAYEPRAPLLSASCPIDTVNAREDDDSAWQSWYDFVDLPLPSTHANNTTASTCETATTARRLRSSSNAPEVFSTSIVHNVQEERHEQLHPSSPLTTDEMGTPFLSDVPPALDLSDRGVLSTKRGTPEQRPQASSRPSRLLFNKVSLASTIQSMLSP